MKMTQLRTLLDKARAAARKAGSPPLTWAAIAKMCGVSRAHLYNLLGASQAATEHVRERLAKGLKPLGVSRKALDSALDKDELL